MVRQACRTAAAGAKSVKRLFAMLAVDAAFTTNLKHHLTQIRSECARREALGEMRRVLDSYNAAREKRLERTGGNNRDH